MSHAAQVPQVVREYFAKRGIDTTARYAHPIIREVFYLGELRGWEVHPGAKRVSGNELRRLRRAGATSVQLVSLGVLADFSIKELTR